MCTNFEIAPVIFEIFIIREPATTPVLPRDTGGRDTGHRRRRRRCGTTEISK